MQWRSIHKRVGISICFNFFHCFSFIHVGYTFIGAEIITRKAVDIEETIYDQFRKNPGKVYRDKLRGLISNLRDKNNPNLRRRVVSGEIPVDVFCTMSKEVTHSFKQKKFFYIVYFFD